MNERTPVDPRRLAAYAFAAAMVLAPFLALIYGWNVGLAVMAFALAATTYLAIDAARAADAATLPRLRRMIAVNAALCLLCVVVLVLRER